MSKELILILGGARAGKSDLAQALARDRGERVLFVATAEAGDEDMAHRIAAHQRQRPAHWSLLEEPLNVAEALARRGGQYNVVLLDCLTLWVSNVLSQHAGEPDIESRILAMAEDLLLRYREDSSTWIVVSNEVGLGVVPATPLGRVFRDALGRVNRLVASHADHVYLTVAGVALDLKATGASLIQEPGEDGGP